MKNRKQLSFIMALSMFLQAILLFPGYASAEDTLPTEDSSTDAVYTLTFIVDGKVAQNRLAEAGKAIGPLPQIWASDGEILSSWQCEECPVSPETIPTANMILTAADCTIAQAASLG